jgi:hypothetical protein
MHQFLKFILFCSSILIQNKNKIKLKENKFGKLVHPVGFNTKIYHDARPYKREIRQTKV